MDVWCVEASACPRTLSSLHYQQVSIDSAPQVRDRGYNVVKEDDKTTFIALLPCTVTVDPACVFVYVTSDCRWCPLTKCTVIDRDARIFIYIGGDTTSTTPTTDICGIRDSNDCIVAYYNAEDWRRCEFRRLLPTSSRPPPTSSSCTQQHRTQSIYLDTTGAALYPESLPWLQCRALQSNVYGNPHSGNPSSRASSEQVQRARQQVLHLFDVPDEGMYSVIWTSGATGACKLLGDSFPWARAASSSSSSSSSSSNSSEPGFIYLRASHHSVLGLRDIAQAHNVRTLACSTIEDLTSAVEATCSSSSTTTDSAREILVTYPAMCNATGRLYDLALVRRLQCLSTVGVRVRVLLDTAAYLSNERLSLQDIPADYVVCSFYKIFGLPTGLGALVARTSPITTRDHDTPPQRQQPPATLHKVYHGGGTLDAVFDDESVVRRGLTQRMEDGTLPFLDLVSLNLAFDFFHPHHGAIYFDIQQHVRSLSQYLYNRLIDLRHAVGTPVVRVHGRGVQGRGMGYGCIINLSILEPDGSPVGHVLIEKLAALHNIHLRTGCFCNSGACMEYLQHSNEDVKLFYDQGHVCGDAKDVISGKPTGSIRVSLGYHCSQKDDCDPFISFIQQTFIRDDNSDNTSTTSTSTSTANAHDVRATLSAIVLYPIKSAHGLSVSTWPLGPYGLMHDREWAVITANGTTIGQKACPRLLTLQPHIDLEQGIVTLSSPHCPQNISFDLHTPPAGGMMDMSVCGDRCQVAVYSQEICIWVSQALGRRCFLVRKTTSETRVDPGSATNTNTTGSGRGKGEGQGEKGAKVGKDYAQVGFANQSQLLLVSQSSVDDLNRRLTQQGEDVIPWNRFRPNLVVSPHNSTPGNPLAPYAEDQWKLCRMHTSAGDTISLACGQRCSRCAVINTSQDTGTSTGSQPLKELSLYRRHDSLIYFGRYLYQLPVSRGIVNNSSSNDDDDDDDTVPILSVGMEVTAHYAI